MLRTRAQFRFVMKAVGLLLVGLSIKAVAGGLTHVIWASLYGAPYASMGLSEVLYSLGAGFVGEAAQFAMGLYLFLGGRWILNMAYPLGSLGCPECGHDVSHGAGDRCPECGCILPETFRRVGETTGSQRAS